MRTHDWIYVGIKLLAVIFAVIGVALASVVLIGIILQIVFMGLQNPEGAYSSCAHYYNFISLVTPATLIFSSWVLARNTGLVFKLLRVQVPHDEMEKNKNESSH